jgi:hypothetical protein
VVAVETSHWFALPFAALFMFGYFYVAGRLIGEQTQARRQLLAPVAGS